MRLFLAAIAAAAALVASLPAAAQQAGAGGAQPQQPQEQQQSQQPQPHPKVDVTRNGDWEVACQEVEQDGKKAKVCEMRQILIRQETKEEWLRIVVAYAPGGTDPVLRIFTPLGVLLQPGMVLKVDTSEPIQMHYAVCLARPPRCLIAGPMDTNMVSLLKRGVNGSLSFMLPNNQKVNAPFSLKGFTASLNALPKG